MIKLKLTQRGRTPEGRTVEVYDWAMECAAEVMDATIFTRMVYPDTDTQTYFAEMITAIYDEAIEKASVPR